LERERERERVKVNASGDMMSVCVVLRKDTRIAQTECVAKEIMKKWCGPVIQK